MGWNGSLNLSHLKKKGSTKEVNIYFFWCDADKIKSVKHVRYKVSRILEAKELENFELDEKVYYENY